MKKLVIIIALFVVLIILAKISNAQNLQSVLTAIEKFESDIKVLINTEKETRTKEIGFLKRKIAALKTRPAREVVKAADPKLKNTVTDLKSRVNELGNSVTIIRKEFNKELENIRNTQNKEPGSSEVIKNISSSLSELKLLIQNELNKPQPVLDRSDVTEEKNNSPDQLATGTKSYTISGFVDASHYYDSEGSANSAGLDQVEIDITKDFSEITGLRADIEYVNDGAGGFIHDIEQGYLTLKPFKGKDFSFTFGKFNAPVGFELLDAPDMYQYSHALVFNFGLPTNLTGVMFSAPLSKTADLSAYIVNGWDLNVDNNKDKTVCGRLGFTPNEKLLIGFSGIYGAQSKTPGKKLTIADIDVTYNAADNLVFGGEFNLGSEDVPDADNSKVEWISGHVSL